MDINLRKGLKGLLSTRNKEGSSKDVPKSQVPTNLPPPPLLPMTLVGLLPCPDLKKKRKVQKVEKGEVQTTGRILLRLKCANSNALGLLGWS